MIVFLLIAFIGISYAFYTAVIDNGDEGSSIISRAGNLEVTYTDGSKQIIGATIYPGWSDSKTFTVKNTGNAAASYSIMVTNMSNMFQNISATTGYARTQTDADKFNASSNKSSGLTFVVKS